MTNQPNGTPLDTYARRIEELEQREREARELITDLIAELRCFERSDWCGPAMELGGGKGACSSCKAKGRAALLELLEVSDDGT